VRGKVQELTAVTGVAGVGEEKSRGGGSTANRGGDGIPVAGGQESGGEVARKLPRDDVVLMVCLAGLRGGGSSGRRRGRAAAEARAPRRSGPGDLVRESAIERVCEHQWVAAVLLEHWIKGGKRQRRLSTVS
jgi:hypothetical protein